jgi:hypothetical protein
LGEYSFVGGGLSNTISNPGTKSTIAGGASNEITDEFATIGATSRHTFSALSF